MDSRNISMALTLPDGPEREKHLNRELLRTACAANVLCRCGAILDCHNAINIELHQCGNQILDRTYCPSCGALIVAGIESLCDQVAARSGNGPVSAKIIVGADLYGRGRRRT